MYAFVNALPALARCGAGGPCERKYGTPHVMAVRYSEHNRRNPRVPNSEPCPWFLLCPEAVQTGMLCSGASGNKMYIEDIIVAMRGTGAVIPPEVIAAVPWAAV